VDVIDLDFLGKSGSARIIKVSVKMNTDKNFFFWLPNLIGF